MRGLKTIVFLLLAAAACTPNAPHAPPTSDAAAPRVVRDTAAAPRWSVPHGHEFWADGADRRGAELDFERVADRVRAAVRPDGAGVLRAAMTAAAARVDAGGVFVKPVVRGCDCELNIRSGAWRVGGAAGAGNALERVVVGDTVQALLDANIGLVEHVQFRPDGLEISWVLNEAPGDGPVELRARFAGARVGEPDADGRFALLGDGDKRIGRVHPVRVVDADGRMHRLNARPAGDELAIVVPPEVLANAAYPLAVDPFVEFDVADIDAKITDFGGFLRVAANNPADPLDRMYLLVFGSHEKNDPNIPGMANAALDWGNARIWVSRVSAHTGDNLDPQGILLEEVVCAVDETLTGSVDVASNGADFVVVWENTGVIRAQRVNADGTVAAAQIVSDNDEVDLDPAWEQRECTCTRADCDAENECECEVSCECDDDYDRNAFCSFAADRRNVYPQIAYARDPADNDAENEGVFLVSWTNVKDDGRTPFADPATQAQNAWRSCNDTVMARRLNHTGTPLGTDDTVILADAWGALTDLAANRNDFALVSLHAGDYDPEICDAENDTPAAPSPLAYTKFIDGATGDPSGPTHLLPTDTAAPVANAAIASDGTRYLAAWADAAGADYSVRARAIQADATPGDADGEADVDPVVTVAADVKTAAGAPPELSAASNGLNYLVGYTKFRETYNGKSFDDAHGRLLTTADPPTAGAEARLDARDRLAAYTGVANLTTAPSSDQYLAVTFQETQGEGPKPSRGVFARRFDGPDTTIEAIDTASPLYMSMPRFVQGTDPTLGGVNGFAMVAWADEAAAGNGSIRGMYMRHDAREQWASPIYMSFGCDHSASEANAAPLVLSATTTRYLVVYKLRKCGVPEGQGCLTSNDFDTEIWGRVWNTNGTGFGNWLRISGTAVDEGEPTAAPGNDANGNLGWLVVWRRDNGTSDDIVGRFVRGDVTDTMGAEFVVRNTSGELSQPALAYGDVNNGGTTDEKFFVVWRDGTSALRGITVEADGTGAGTEFDVKTGATNLSKPWVTAMAPVTGTTFTTLFVTWFEGTSDPNLLGRAYLGDVAQTAFTIADATTHTVAPIDKQGRERVTAVDQNVNPPSGDPAVYVGYTSDADGQTTAMFRRYKLATDGTVGNAETPIIMSNFAGDQRKLAMANTMLAPARNGTGNSRFPFVFEDTRGGRREIYGSGVQWSWTNTTLLRWQNLPLSRSTARLDFADPHMPIVNVGHAAHTAYDCEVGGGTTKCWAVVWNSNGNVYLSRIVADGYRNLDPEGVLISDGHWPSVVVWPGDCNAHVAGDQRCFAISYARVTSIPAFTLARIDDPTLQIDLNDLRVSFGTSPQVSLAAGDNEIVLAWGDSNGRGNVRRISMAAAPAAPWNLDDLVIGAAAEFDDAGEAPGGALVAGSGSGFLVYYNLAGPFTRARQLDGDGAPIGTPTTVYNGATTPIWNKLAYADTDCDTGTAGVQPCYLVVGNRQVVFSWASMFAQRLKTDGTTLGGEITISNATEAQEMNDVTYLPSIDRFVVVFNTLERSTTHLRRSDIHGRTVNPATGAVGTETVLLRSDSIATAPFVAAGDGSEVLVGYGRQVGAVASWLAKVRRWAP